MQPRLAVCHNYQVQGASALRDRGYQAAHQGRDFVAEHWANRDRRELDRLEPRLAVDSGH